MAKSQAIIQAYESINLKGKKRNPSQRNHFIKCHILLAWKFFRCVRLHWIVHNALASVRRSIYSYFEAKFHFHTQFKHNRTSTLNKHHFIKLFSPIGLNANSIERHCHSVDRIFSTHQPIIKKGAASVFAHHQRQEDGNLIYAVHV